MAVSSNEYQDALRRIRALEDAVNSILVAITKFVTVDQVTQLGLLRQTEVAQHSVQLVGVESRLSVLESYHRV